MIVLTTKSSSALENRMREMVFGFHHDHTCLSPRLQAVLIPDVIDVEAPEYSARDLLLLLFLEPDARCSRCFRAAVPVHARYHRPAEGTEEALVVLESPEVLLCCCHGKILIDVLGQSRAWNVVVSEMELLVVA